MRITGRLVIISGIAGLVFGAGSRAAAAEKKFRNFNLTCLAPLLEKTDSEAPANMQLAFLRGPSRAPELREDLGTVDFPISTQSPEAAAYFNQGAALLHGLANRDAERCFRQVLEHDAHHPMAYWGLAMANEQRPGRARLFTQNAVRRVRNDTSARERLWIAAIGNFYNLRREGPAVLPPAEKLSDEERRERFRQRIRDLEAISLAHPDDVEAKAFLLRQLTLDEHRHGMPVTSHVAVDRLARDLAEAAPKHPSRHYHIFLWLAERPEHSLPAAERSRVRSHRELRTAGASRRRPSARTAGTTKRFPSSKRRCASSTPPCGMISPCRATRGRSSRTTPPSSRPSGRWAASRRPSAAPGNSSRFRAFSRRRRAWWSRRRLPMRDGSPLWRPSSKRNSRRASCRSCRKTNCSSRTPPSRESVPSTPTGGRWPLSSSIASRKPPRSGRNLRRSRGKRTRRRNAGPSRRWWRDWRACTPCVSARRRNSRRRRFRNSP